MRMIYYCMMLPHATAYRSHNGLFNSPPHLHFIWWLGALTLGVEQIRKGPLSRLHSSTHHKNLCTHYLHAHTCTKSYTPAHNPIQAPHARTHACTHTRTHYTPIHTIYTTPPPKYLPKHPYFIAHKSNTHTQQIFTTHTHITLTCTHKYIDLHHTNTNHTYQHNLLTPKPNTHHTSHHTQQSYNHACSIARAHAPALACHLHTHAHAHTHF